MRSRASTTTMAAGAVIGAGLLGLAVIFRPGVTIPFTLQLIVLLGLTTRLLLRESDPDLQKWLRRLVFGALAVRLVVAVAVHFGPVLSPYLFAPDSIGYEAIGHQLADFWRGVGPEPTRYSGWKMGYYSLNGLFVLAYTESSFALVILNIFAGVWTVLVSFYLTRDLLDARSAKMTALLTAFFPSLILWSILNIRDSMATFTVVLIVWAGVRLSSRVRARDLVMLAVGLLALSALRDYMGFLVLCGLMVGSFTAVRPDRVLASLAMGTFLVVVLTYAADRLALFTSIRPEDVLQTATQLRLDMQTGAGSAFGVGANTGTVGGAIQYLPLGAANLLFAPFPWAIQSTLQVFAMPETLLWYPLAALGLKGLLIFRRRGGSPRVMIPLSVLLVTTASYALVEGNFGTAYRHRAQLMPLFFIFSGIGLQWFNERVLRTVPWSRRSLALSVRRRQHRRVRPAPRT